MRSSRAALPLAVTLALAAAACTPKRPALPSGPGASFPEFAIAYNQASAECASVTALTAALGLSGRAGGTRLRGRIDAGFAAPSDLRLEGVAPFGKPVFVLVSQGDRATLVLPRDGRVLRGAAPAAIVDALAGVPLGPAELRGLVAGCGLAPGVPSAGRSYGGGWVAVDAGDTTTYVRQIDGRWRVGASTRGAITVDYADFSGGRAQTVHVRTTPAPGRPAADLTLRISQLEINVPLDRAAFEYDVPPDWTPLTLDQLRRAGPLGGDDK
jgi:hypothetical protein